MLERKGGQVKLTSEAFTVLLQERGIWVSMAGKGRCQDNISWSPDLIGVGDQQVRGAPMESG